jgi:transcriptional regulator with XRE-family HTH domain
MPKDEPENQSSDASGPTSRQAIGEEIRRQREERGLTQGELAERVNASTSKISRIETGETPLDYELMSQIAKALGTSAPVLAFNAQVRGLPDDPLHRQLTALMQTLLKNA